MLFDDSDSNFDERDKLKRRSRFEMDSPKGSISSKSSFVMCDEKNLIDEEEEDQEFEDAVSVSIVNVEESTAESKVQERDKVEIK
jgi:hypothetical protein